MFVKPKLGALVRDPVTRRQLPADGADVPETSFWLRRLATGDVVLDEQNTEHGENVLPVPEESEQ